MTDLTGELVAPLHQARALLRSPGPANIDRAIPLFARVIQTLSGLRDRGEPLPESTLEIVRSIRREVLAIALLLDRAAALNGAVLQGLTDRSRRDSAALRMEI